MHRSRCRGVLRTRRLRGPKISWTGFGPAIKSWCRAHWPIEIRRFGRGSRSRQYYCRLKSPFFQQVISVLFNDAFAHHNGVSELTCKHFQSVVTQMKLIRYTLASIKVHSYFERNPEGTRLQIRRTGRLYATDLNACCQSIQPLTPVRATLVPNASLAEP